jgi:hypothetical protein
MNTTIIKPEEQAEAIRLSRVATGPSIGDSAFWGEFISNLDAMEREDAQIVKPREKRQD